MQKLFTALAISLAAAGPAAAHTVTATVYAADFHGGPNYCDGRPYQHWGVSAASSWLPCGARVRVSHRGRVLTVPVRDRCASCDIDLSAGAAYRLGIPLDGIATVRISL